MPIVNNGTQGSSLTADQIETLSHFTYNAATDRLEATREIMATLNSFLLGAQHSISSGGENVFFRNLTSNIDWFPAWSGILEQSNVANRGRSGVIPPSIRTYDSLAFIEVYGNLGTGVVPYADSTTIEGANSLHGIVFVIEEAITAQDYIQYNLHRGADDTGPQMYNQLFTGTAYNAGDTVTLWFTHPLETAAGTDVYSAITILIGGKDGVKHICDVRSNVDGDHHHSIAAVRPFIDAGLHHRRPIIHSADYTGGGTYMFLDRDGGREVHLEVADATMHLNCALIVDDFQLKLVNTSTADATFDITGATSVGFRDGQPYVNLASIPGNYTLVVEPNHTVLLSVTVVGTDHFVNLNHLIDLTVPLDIAEQLIFNLQTAEVMTMNLLFPPATGQNAFIVSYPNTLGGYVFFDPQNTGNQQELIWP